MGNQGRKGTVGFALTILQRRLASSPEAIYQSLKRRRERLEKRLREEEIFKRGSVVDFDLNKVVNKVVNVEDIEIEASADNCEIRYIHKPFQQEPDFAATSVNYNLQELWQRGIEPSLFFDTV